MHYFADYGLFLAKTLTFVITFLILLAGVFAMILKNKSQSKEHLEIKKINQKYHEMEETIRKEILPKKTYKAFLKEKEKSENEKKAQKNKKRLFVIHFNGDIRATAVDHLREEITAILSVANSHDEVVVCVESSGGLVHGYGLCASQLLRIKAQKIPLTIMIDKIAASGGYMMACVADKILAAPFAMIGSIGVVAQIPNFHRWLQKQEIDFEQITAGEYKRTLTLFGENTQKARDKMKDDIEEIHYYFKNFITTHRPHLDIDKVSTGEHWLATKALELKLIDGLNTSDDYLFSKYKTIDIFEVKYLKKKSFSDRFSLLMEEKSHLYFPQYFA